MNRRVATFFLFLFLSLASLAVFPLCVYAEEEKDTSSFSEVKIEFSLSEKPLVRVIPGSPLGLLRLAWERTRIFFESSSREKALLAIQFAGKRLGEAIQVATRRENVERIEKIYQERAKLLEESYKHAGDDPEVRKELLQQLVLGENVLESSKENYSSPQALEKLQDLSKRQRNWVQSLEYGLSAESEGFFDLEKIATLESSLSAEVLGQQDLEESFIFRVVKFLFGTRNKLVSPLQTPKRID
ncbi:MAG: DUF5667 domain-containing protein [Patescibacteria group bacterium]|nr:DUF5667 domain-containing protein [Patescibacteria group bacterium]